MQQICKNRRVAGNVAVEFLLIIPSMMVVIAFVLEFSLLWIDRHYLRLAAYESARVYSSSTASNPCTDTLKAKEASRKAWWRVASVAPSVEAFTRTKSIDTPSILKELSLAEAFLYQFRRLPSAMFSTKVTCIYDAKDPHVVSVKLRYLRAPQVPFAKDVMWALYLMREVATWLKSQGLDELFSVGLDSWYVNMVILKEGIFSPDLVHKLKSFTDDKQKVTTSALQEKAVAEYMDFFSNLIGKQEALRDQLQKQLDKINNMIKKAPWQWRFIPMNMEVTLVRQGYLNRDKDWVDGQAFLVAPFNLRKAPHWRQWAEQLMNNPQSLSK